MNNIEQRISELYKSIHSTKRISIEDYNKALLVVKNYNRQIVLDNNRYIEIRQLEELLSKDDTPTPQVNNDDTPTPQVNNKPTIKRKIFRVGKRRKRVAPEFRLKAKIEKPKIEHPETDENHINLYEHLRHKIRVLNGIRAVYLAKYNKEIDFKNIPIDFIKDFDFDLFRTFRNVGAKSYYELISILNELDLNPQNKEYNRKLY